MDLEKLFQGMEGFNTANYETLEYLTKALTAGSGVDAGSFSGGRALIPESLDGTLVNILWSQDEARLFKMLKKQPIKSPVHQWDERTGVGDDDGAWVPEGGDSEEKDQIIARKYVTAKYLQTLRKVTIQAQISNMIEDAISLEKNAGTLWVIRQTEKALFYGDSSIVAEQPDGLVKLIPASNVVDLRGQNASSVSFENKFEEACRQIRDNYGKASSAFMSTMVMQDVQRLLRDRMRVAPGKASSGSVVFEDYTTPFGTPKLIDDIFIREGSTPVASTLTAKRAGAPTVNTGGVTTPADSASKFYAADAGDYWYRIVAVNRYGDSTSTPTTSAITVAAGDKVIIPVTEGSPAATGYKVYRSKKGAADASDCRYMFSVARTGASQNIEDFNEALPGCSDVFVLTMDQVYDAIEWAQFLPLMKFDLYPTNAAVTPFLLLLFGALAVKKGVQHVRIKNVSPANFSWF